MAAPLIHTCQKPLSTGVEEWRTRSEATEHLSLQPQPFLAQPTITNITTQLSNHDSWILKQKKINPAIWQLVGGKFRLPKVEHPMFEGHVTPNEDEYENLSS